MGPGTAKCEHPRSAARGGDVVTVMRELAALVRAHSDPDAMLHRVANEVFKLIPKADGASFQLVDGDTIRCVCATGSLQDMNGMVIPLQRSLSGSALRLGQTLRSDNTPSDPRFARQTRERLAAKSVLCVPLRHAGRDVGTFGLASTRPRAFSDREVVIANRLSELLTALVTSATAVAGATAELFASQDVAGQSTDETALSWFVLNLLCPDTAQQLHAVADIEHVLANRLFSFAYQPLVNLSDGSVPIVEALCRFDPEPYRSPDQWFADAWRAGLGLELELAALEGAAAHLDALPRGARLAVNLSPQVVIDPMLAEVLVRCGPERFVIELTEHVAIEDYACVRRALGCLSERGVRFAVDDAGAGYASFSHILNLAPDIIKLDRELIRGIDADPVRRSLAASLVRFAAEIGATVVAEGVETPTELYTVHELGIPLAQGHLIALPRPGEARGLARLGRSRPGTEPGRMRVARRTS